MTIKLILSYLMMAEFVLYLVTIITYTKNIILIIYVADYIRFKYMMN